MGSALAQRSVGFGHDTRVLCRSLQSRTNRLLPKQVLLEPIAHAEVTEMDLLLIAAPAYANRHKEGLISAFLRRLDNSVSVCSGAAYADAPTAEWARDRPFLQFVCSPALANTQRPPLVLVHGTSRTARSKFVSWLGPARVHYANRRKFERLTFLMAIAPLHSETLRRVIGSLKTNANERRLISETLPEAYALMEVSGFDPEAAIDACSTPHGFTRAAIQQFLGSPSRSPRSTRPR